MTAPKCLPMIALLGCTPLPEAIPQTGETTSLQTTPTGTTGSGTTSSTRGSTDTADTGLLFADDRDQDSIPDDYDPFPDDPLRPGVAGHETIYAHDHSTLHYMNVVTYAIGTIGALSFVDAAGGSMTDIAIDRYGVLYGCTYTDLFVCHPQSAECWHIGPLSGTYNGLTFVPAGTLDPNEDVLVAIASSGDWYRLDGYLNQQLTTSLIGGYGPGNYSSGDAFSIDSVGSWAAINGGHIVSVSPTDGTVGPEFATAGTNIWGLAGWLDEVFAFDASGQVFSIDPATGSTALITTAPNSWWGAGVRTWIPPNP